MAAAAAGRGGSPATAGPATSRLPAAASLPLTTAVAGQKAGWAVVPLARVTGQRDRFWQLLIQAPASGRWRLATPPGVADTGGLAIAGTPDGTLTAGFVPSEQLRFTPLAMTGDGGAKWSPGLLPVSLAAEPGALASLPGGRLLALTVKSAELSGTDATSWATLVTVRALAASPPGRACGLAGLTAAGAGPSGSPLLAGDCARPGVAGLFAKTAAGWQAAGPALPAELAGK